MTTLRRITSVVGLAALAASAYMCSRSPPHAGGAGGRIDDGSAEAPASDTGGTAAGGGMGGSSGFVGTGGSGGTIATGGGDAGPTGILPCASLPPSSEPVPAGWPAGAKRLPALDPDVYVFEVPPNPESLTWKACGTGCKELVNTWAPSESHGLWADAIGGTAGNAPWLIIRPRLLKSIETWIGPADGAAVRMLAEEVPEGTVPHGFSSPDGIGPAGYVLTAYAHETNNWVMGAPLAGPLRCMFHEHLTTGLVQSFFAFRTSSTRWALWPDGNAPGWSGELPIGSPTAGVPDPVPIPVGYARTDGLFGLPEGFVMTGYRPETTAMFIWTPATGTVPFVTAPPPDQTDMPVASDGNRIAWLHGSGLAVDGGHPSWSKVELMIATESSQFPVTGTSVGVLPTFQPRIGPVDKSWLRGDYFAGWVQCGWPHPVTSKLLQFVPFVLRLSDQRIWIIPRRSPDVLWQDIVYLSDDEIALLERTFQSYVGYADTVVRYRLDSLGPGQTLAEALAAGVP